MSGTDKAGKTVSGAPEPSGERARPSFKLAGHVVMAMKRFQAALNPTYTYGKRPASPTTLPGMPPTHKTLSGERTSSGRTASGRPTRPAMQHGYKGSLLTKPLPPLASEEQSVEA